MRVGRSISVLASFAIVGSLSAAAPAGAQSGYFCAGWEATIVGTEGADRLVGTPGHDVIVALGGNDVILGGDGEDIICGGPGNDRIRGQQMADLIFGEAGNDVILGNWGKDILLGGDGRDNIDGGFGDDIILGDNGSDLLRGGNHIDIVYGGPGQDDIGGANGHDHLEGGTDDDILRGGNGRDELRGDNGDDIINSGAHLDMAFGGDGNDDIRTGGSSGDVIDGGRGADVLDGVSFQSAADSELNLPPDTVLTQSQYEAAIADEYFRLVNCARTGNYSVWCQPGDETGWNVSLFERDGLSAYERSTVLDDRSKTWSEEMAATDNFRHDPSGGRENIAGFSSRLDTYTFADARTAAKDTMNDWMNSAGHRSNILHPAPITYGSGVAVGPVGSNGASWVYSTQRFS